MKLAFYGKEIQRYNYNNSRGSSSRRATRLQPFQKFGEKLNQIHE